jgi:MFS family permease
MTDEQAVQRRKWLALALLASTQFVIILDAAIVNVAIPSIGRDLKFSEEDLTWIPNAYALTFGGFLLLGGRMADLLGRRRLFMIGLVLFSVASLLGGLSTSETQLIAARALQGLGAALIAPAALSMVTNMFAEGAERNKALGVWGAVSGSGGAAGVLLGGILTEYAGWQWVLWVNVPIGIVVAILAPRMLDESRRESESRHFDVAGAITVTAGLSLLVFALVDTINEGWGSTQTLTLLAISFALIVAFVLIELRSKDPLMPFTIFRLRTLTGANIVGLLVGAALFAMFFFLSRYMQEVLGYRVGRCRLRARHEVRLQEGPDHGHGARRDRAPVACAGAGQRLLSVRPARPDGHRRGRAGIRVCAGHDRRRQRRLSGRVRPRVGAHQHLAADRRRAWAGRPGHDRELQDVGPGHRRAGRSRGDPGRADRGLSARVHDRRRIRRDRHHRHAAARPQRGFAGCRGGCARGAPDGLTKP